MRVRLAAASVATVAFLASSPAGARFLQVDPVGYKDQVNLYAYVNNDPVDGRDPSGTHGCGAGLTGSNCDQFRRAENMAAAKLERASDKLKAAIGGSPKDFAKAAKAFEKSFGAGTGNASDMSAVAANMQSMAIALRDDGTAGYWATGLSGSDYAAANRPAGSMAFAPIGGHTMTVNLGHPFFSDTATLSWAAGHETGHSFYLDHPAINGVTPYAMGLTPQRSLFAQLPYISPSAAMSNPDSVMKYSYGYVPQ